MKKTLAIICGIAAAALLAPTAAQAELVEGDVYLVDFGSATNGSFQDGGNYWTGLEAGWNGTTKSMLDTGGNDQSVDVALAEASVAVSNNSSSDWGTGAPDWLTSASINSRNYYVWSSDGHPDTLEIVFSGLNTSLEYKFELVSSRSVDDRTADHTVNGEFSDNLRPDNITPYSDNFDAGIDGHTGHNLMIWDAVEANVDGTIKMRMELVNVSGHINALRIEVVPEPATMGLLGLGFAGMAVLRRRRKK